MCLLLVWKHGDSTALGYAVCGANWLSLPSVMVVQFDIKASDWLLETFKYFKEIILSIIYLALSAQGPFTGITGKRPP